MLKFAIASFLLLQVAFSQEIQGEASLNVEGNVRPSLSNRINNLRDRINGFLSDKSASARFEAAIDGVPGLKERLEEVAEKMSAAAEAIKNNNANRLAELSASLKGINQAIKEFRPFFNAEAGGSMRPAFNAEAGGSMRPSFSAQVRPSANARPARNVRPSFNAQGTSSARPSTNAKSTSNVKGTLNDQDSVFLSRAEI